MLIHGAGETYLFDRDNSGFSAPGLTFPQRKYPDEHITDTLVDGVSTVEFSHQNMKLKSYAPLLPTFALV